MVSFSPCKINLGLQITRKRDDGYHELSTCFYPVPWTDIIEIIPAEEVCLTITGLHIAGDLATNLCLRAYQILQKEFNLPAVKIHLHKIVPTGAGLGGGSSNAAHTLRLLNTIFKLQLSTEKLTSYAAQLGSDCAFFIQDYPMMGAGRGEILTPFRLSLTGKFLVIAKPDVHVSTADAFAAITPTEPTAPLREIISAPIQQWRNTLVNDFEVSVFKKHPIIKDIKEDFYLHGALYASMSGSGSSVFALFDKKVDYKIDNATVWSGWLG